MYINMLFLYVKHTRLIQHDSKLNFDALLNFQQQIFQAFSGEEHVQQYKKKHTPFICVYIYIH